MAFSVRHFTTHINESVRTESHSFNGHRSERRCLQLQKQLDIKEGKSGYNGLTEERAPKCKYKFSSSPRLPPKLCSCGQESKKSRFFSNCLP